MIELHQVAQRAKDLDRAVEFYTTVLGGELMARFEPPGLAFIKMGSVRLLLEQAAPTALIYLRVPDVRESTSRLRAANVTIDTEPHRIHVDTDGAFGEKGFQEWMAFIRDSEDNLVGLASRHPPTEPANGHPPTERANSHPPTAASSRPGAGRR
jgi:methylmalonyl-CoA/ethylmalonyl-CoA epimerase